MARADRHAGEYVSFHVVEMAQNLVRLTEVDADEVFAGLALGWADLDSPDVRLDWDTLTHIVDRVVERVGLEAASAACARLPELAPRSAHLFAAFVSPTTAFRFVIERMAPIQYPMFKIGRITYHDDGSFVHSTRLRDGFRGCRSFFVICGAAMAAVPKFLGLPAAESRTDADERGATYWLKPPPSQTVPARLGRSARRLFEARALEELANVEQRLAEAYEELYRTRAEPDPRAHHARVEAAASGWKLTARQAEVLAGLVRGLSNKELAAEFGCSVKTIEAQLTEMLQRSGTTSRSSLVAKFWTGQ